MRLNRIVYADILADVGRREIRIIVGPRQVGKTTLLKEVEGYFRHKGIRRRYFNLELPADAEFFARDFMDILNDLGRQRQAVLIDEFHYLPNATKLFKSIFDGYPRLKIFASGSSAIEMHKHLKESLAGRRRLYRLCPLSFSEWLPSRPGGVCAPENWQSSVDARTHRLLRQYLEEFVLFGGLPGLVHEKSADSKKRLLIDYLSTYVQKDIKALLREEDILSFNRLIALLADREGSLLSENGLSQDLNYSLRQVRKDIAILSQSFLLDVLKPFFSNRGRELKQTNKTYFFDSGIRNAILRDFRRLNQRLDKGAMLESFVLHEMQTNLQVSQEVYYWRTRQQEEVDFVLVQDRLPIAVEVKSKLMSPEVPAGIRQFFGKYPECPAAVVLNDNMRLRADWDGKQVLFAPHYFARLIPSLFRSLASRRKLVLAQNFVNS